LEFLNKDNSTNLSIYENETVENIIDEDSKYSKNKKNRKISLFSFNLNKFKSNFVDYLKSLKFTYDRKSIMRTPCNHLFHNRCLEKWLEVKNECPYCRREIPIIE